MIKAKCRKCNYEWEYTGFSRYYATCPMCKVSTKLDTKENNDERKGKHGGKG